MRSSGENLLLVEGESDKSLLTKVITRLKLRTDVMVAPPKDVAGRANNKEGLLQHLPTLLEQMPDGRLKRFAIVLDADFAGSHGLGCTKTLDRIEATLNRHSFSLAKSPPQDHGRTFRHPDGLADIGVWIMPDNRADGALEDFLSTCITADEKALFQSAQKAVAGIKNRKFAETHVSKAEIATWFAWQKEPGRGADHALTNGLFDETCPSFVGLTDWLRRIFQ